MLQFRSSVSTVTDIRVWKLDVCVCQSVYLLGVFVISLKLLGVFVISLKFLVWKQPKRPLTINFYFYYDHVLVSKRKQKIYGPNDAATDEKHVAMQMATSLDSAT